MGENEQGGMLRNVVALGLVAIIAGGLFAAIATQKVNMNKRTTQIFSTVDKPVDPGETDQDN